MRKRKPDIKSEFRSFEKEYRFRRLEEFYGGKRGVVFGGQTRGEEKGSGSQHPLSRERL
jgi:hypothetical protein